MSMQTTERTSSVEIQPLAANDPRADLGKLARIKRTGHGPQPLVIGVRWA